MMLDNKNEQKWPLTEKEVLKKNKQSRVISFAARLPAGSIFYAPAGEKKTGSPQAAQHIYHTIRLRESQHLIDWKFAFLRVAPFKWNFFG